MLIENGTVAVRASDWDAVLRGDRAARRRVSLDLHGVRSYCHALTFDEKDQQEHWTLVSVITLMDMGIVSGITLDCGSGGK